MWDDACDHAVQLEDSCDFYEERREVRRGGVCCRSWACANTGHFDIVRPSDEEGRVILPVEVAFEKIGSGTIRRTVYKDNAGLGGMVIDLDTL